MATTEDKILKHSGEYLLAPHLQEHDYVLVPSDQPQMIYYDQQPECLQNFRYFRILNRAEVNKIDLRNFFMIHFFPPRL